MNFHKTTKRTYKFRTNKILAFKKCILKINRKELNLLHEILILINLALGIQDNIKICKFYSFIKYNVYKL